MLRNTPLATQQLKNILNEFIQDPNTRNGLNFEKYKNKAMACVADGADIMVRDNFGVLSLFHILVMSNELNVNAKEINELINSNKSLVDVRTGLMQRTPLQMLFNSSGLSEQSFISTTMILARNGANLNVHDKDNGHTLMHHLVMHNQKKMYDAEIQELVSLDNTLINIKDADGRTPLQSLIRSRIPTSIEEIEAQIALGSDLNNKDNNNETLLHAAVIAGKYEVAQYLARKGLDVHAKTKTNQTMLHCAVSNDNDIIWTWLLENKIAINAQDDMGRTAMHDAVIYNRQKMLTWLLANYAKENLRDLKNKTPLQYALACDRGAVSILNAADATQPISPKDLLSSIDAMESYGRLLQAKGAKKKGKMVVDLADQLKQKVGQAFQDHSEPADMSQFYREFVQLLNSKNDQMEKYRFAWKTVVANVALALTGIGILAIAGKLIHSKVTHGRALFFFQNKKTTSEEKVAAVAQVGARVLV